MSKRLPFEDKKELLRLHKSGTSISVLSRKFNVSRTIIYKWISEGKIGGNGKQMPKKTAHWKRYPKSIEKKIVKYSLLHPDYSPQLVAEKLKLGHNGVWRVLKRHDLNTKEARFTYIDSGAYKVKKSSTPDIKIDLIQQYYKGAKATKLCAQYHISRTTFYKWLAAYNKAEDKKTAFVNKRSRRDSHWRFIPELRERVLEVVKTHPEYSAHRIREVLISSFAMPALSHNTVHSILKENNISRYHARVAFASTLEIAQSPTSQHKKAESVFNRQFTVTVTLPTVDQVFKGVLYGILLTSFACFMVLLAVIVKESVIIPDPVSVTRNTTINEIIPQPREIVKDIQVEPSLINQFEDFTTGVLAVNTDKNVYKVGEQINLIFSVLDKKGITVCDARVSLRVKDPNGEIHEYSTTDSSIMTAATCDPVNYSHMPDYWVQIAASKPGMYEIDVASFTKDGVERFTDQLTVLDDRSYAQQPFIIQRSSMPTRIYPSGSYRAEVIVDFQEDFTGRIVEKLSPGIIINNASDLGVVEEDISGQTISWGIEAKKGEQKAFSYSVSFPTTSPEFYLIGPATFESNGITYGGVLTDYNWQIALDAP